MTYSNVVVKESELGRQRQNYRFKVSKENASLSNQPLVEVKLSTDIRALDYWQVPQGPQCKYCGEGHSNALGPRVNATQKVRRK